MSKLPDPEKHNGQRKTTTKKEERSRPPTKAELAYYDATLYKGPKKNYANFRFEKYFKFGEPRNFIMYGESNSGKTTLLKKWFPEFRRNYDILFFFCQSLNANVYDDMLTEDDMKFAFSEHVAEIMRDMYVIQSNIKNKLKIMFLFDDNNEENLGKNKWLNNQFLYGRNLNMSSFVICHRLNLLSATIRQNTHGLFIKKCRTAESKNMMIDRFLRHQLKIPTEELRIYDQKMLMTKWIDANTENFNTVFLDFLNQDASTQITKLYSDRDKKLASLLKL
jgi:hypothetical protein